VDFFLCCTFALWATKAKLMNRTTVVLSVLCIILLVVCGLLGWALFSKPRFVTVAGANPYIMFDNKTAQACWSGPPAPTQPTEGLNPNGFDWNKYPIVGGSEDNPPHLPFCKNLK